MNFEIKNQKNHIYITNRRITRANRKQEELVREYENKLKKIIYNEINYEKTENSEKLSTNNCQKNR